MSFGFAVGDFLAVGQLCWKVYKNCKESSGKYAELSSEVGALHNVVKETEELLAQQSLTTVQQERLATCCSGCRDVLQELNTLLVKYESLGTQSRRTFDRIGFGKHDVGQSVGSSHARLERKLDMFITEVRAGKREGSVVSVASIDTVARNDREIWGILRKELEDIGISPVIISARKQFMIDWFRAAVVTGEFEEDIPSDSSDSYRSTTAKTSELNHSRHKASHLIDVATNRERSVTSSSDNTNDSICSTAVLKGSPTDPDPLQASERRQHRQSPTNGKQSSGLVLSLLDALSSESSKFMRALKAGDTRSASSFLAKGLDIDIDIRGWTPLNRAVFSDNEVIARFLLENGANVNWRSSSKLFKSHSLIEMRKDTTLLHNAASGGGAGMARLLLRYGADVNAKNTVGKNALLLTIHEGASSRGNCDVVEVLLENGANIESRDNLGRALLHRAALWGTFDLLELLLENGADIEARTNKGETPLHMSVTHSFCVENEKKRKNRKKMVAFLHRKGADLDAKRNDGKSVRDLAIDKGYARAKGYPMFSQPE